MKNWVLVFCGILMVQFTNAQEKGIINNSKSPHVKLKSIDLGDCKWTEGFWAERFKVAEENMLPYMEEVLTGDVGHGLNNFKRAAGHEKGTFNGWYWHDGDFYKFMEAKTYMYAQNGDAKIVEELDGYIKVIAEAQEEDGYLQTHTTINNKYDFNAKEKKTTAPRNVGETDRYANRKYHEMYNQGHLFTSACIHHRVTGKRNFLDIAIKQADLLCSYFLPDNDHYGRFGFNQTQIMGLVEMYRTVGDERYLKLAEKFINNRGKYKVEDHVTTIGYPIGDMVQERTALRDADEAVGHAVLALYYYAGAADVYAETGEDDLIEALDRLWFNVAEQKMYVTGACGQTHYGCSTNRDKIEEGFLDKYMMPNLTSYNETCANLCNAMFSKRMLDIHADAKYADVMELVMHNSGLSGISLEGKHYYYANNLRKIDGARDYAKLTNDFEERQPYLQCFCCPPNLVRNVCKLSGWAYSKSANGISVNLYGGNELNTTLLDGSALELTQVTNYPWEGQVDITINKCKKSAFDMVLRIPGWAEGTTVKVNGQDAGVTAKAGEFVTVNRKWKKGDKITVDMPMDVTFVEGHTHIEEVRNQVAVKRGPIVYCMESADLPEGAKIMDVYLNGDAEMKAVFKKDLLAGVTAIEAEVKIRKDNNTEKMYKAVKKPEFETIKTQFVPYFSWSNRGKGEMSVFVPVIW
ncbi:glycoside hydrolase family 127 protein [Labilibacter marinus]|uniref:glycoside hydrolase family 127 protein n=1 Tax=Labilibacter marinus TaxID=1477105 RepID=UPI0009FA8AF7|nr:beta-L-arabinofuranosidase domain-containing protein [Labilibacter marinus]